nr:MULTISPECIES: hypothetical protein [unclassified Frankia]
MTTGGIVAAVSAARRASRVRDFTVPGGTPRACAAWPTELPRK